MACRCGGNCRCGKAAESFSAEPMYMGDYWECSECNSQHQKFDDAQACCTESFSAEHICSCGSGLEQIDDNPFCKKCVCNKCGAERKSGPSYSYCEICYEELNPEDTGYSQSGYYAESPISLKSESFSADEYGNTGRDCPDCGLSLVYEVAKKIDVCANSGCSYEDITDSDYPDEFYGAESLSAESYGSGAAFCFPCGAKTDTIKGGCVLCSRWKPHCSECGRIGKKMVSSTLCSVCAKTPMKWIGDEDEWLNAESLVYAREHPRPVVAGAVGGALAIGALVGLRNKSVFREGTPTWMRWTATGLIAATALAVGVYGTEFIYQLSENR